MEGDYWTIDKEFEDLLVRDFFIYPYFGGCELDDEVRNQMKINLIFLNVGIK